MFQIFDGAQVTLTGILRGIGISRITSITTFIGYWVIGIPCGYFFAHYLNLRVRGFWGGQALALTIVAIILFIKLKLEFRKHERIS